MKTPDNTPTRMIAITAAQAYALAEAWRIADNEGIATGALGLPELLDALDTWASQGGGVPPPRPPRNPLSSVEEIDLEANHTQGVITDEIDLEQEGKRE